MRGGRILRVFSIWAINIILLAALILLVPMVIDRVRYGKFIIEGMVVDEGGNPLDNVRVWVTDGRRINMGFDSEDKERVVAISREFRFQESKCTDVSLIFMKDGFQYETLS